MQNSDDIEVSLDGGETWSSMNAGVRIIYRGLPGDQDGETLDVHLNITREGVITDIWNGDDCVATDCYEIGDIVARLLPDDCDDDLLDDEQQEKPGLRQR